MAASRTGIEVDYTTTHFIRGNKTHQDFIKQEISQFNTVFNELCNYDKRAGLVSGLMGLAWVFNSITLFSGAVVSISFALLSREFFGRPDYAKQYQDQLNKLFELYNWCVKHGGGKDITTDKTFLTLTETILPFIEYEYLKRPFANFNGVSENFSKLFLLSHLHKDKFVNDQEQSQEGYFGFNFFSADKKQDDKLVKMARKADYLPSIIYGKIRFDFYSRQTSQPRSMYERCQEIVEPLLKMKLT